MLTIGVTIILEKSESDQLETYKCKLMDIRDGILYIDYPVNIHTNRIDYLINGTHLKGTFVGKDRNTYLFSSEIKGRVRENIPLLLLDYPGDENLQKIQRREFVRVSLSSNVNVQPVNDEFEPFTALTTDISAGGAAIIVPKNTKIEPHKFLIMHFIFEMKNRDVHELSIQVKVKRIVDRANQRKKVSVEFLDISEAERQILLRYCFERQLEERNRS
jgi:c-di-GMP-binding flagellar brake protein YcgR